MALFEVPGWSVPAAPVPGPSTKSHKRKRHDAERGQDTEAKIQSAAATLEKLVSTLGSVVNVGEGASKKKNKRGKEKEVAKGKEKGKGSALVKGSEKGAQQGKGKNGPEKKGQGKEKSRPQGDSRNPERQGKKKNGKKIDSAPKSAKDDSEKAAASPSQKKQKKQSDSEEGGLTALQATMKQSLDGARFRWINETLYKSESAHAVEMVRENPAVFTEYHTGFRHQVQSWPANPVTHYIEALSPYLSKTVIADLGCGDAALARALVPKGFTVLSYDLVSDSSFVVAADICSKIPLPGAEVMEEGQEAAQVVDVVICALSLMSTNWVGCIREAWRILKPSGELKIAEVASRFTEVEAFASLVSSVGFKLHSKDDSNSHFTLFEFSKVTRKPKSDKEWSKMMARGSVLKPCEYKRR